MALLVEDCEVGAVTVSAEVGIRIKSLRDARRLTQQDLAARSGMSKGFISQVEAGKVGIGVESLERISQALEVPSHFLLNHELWKSESTHQIADRGALDILATTKKLEDRYYRGLSEALDSPLGRPRGVEDWAATYRTLRKWKPLRTRTRKSHTARD